MSEGGQEDEKKGTTRELEVCASLVRDEVNQFIILFKERELMKRVKKSMPTNEEAQSTFEAFPFDHARDLADFTQLLVTGPKTQEDFVFMWMCERRYGWREK